MSRFKVVKRVSVEESEREKFKDEVVNRFVSRRVSPVKVGFGPLK